MASTDRRQRRLELARGVGVNLRDRRDACVEGDHLHERALGQVAEDDAHPADLALALFGEDVVGLEAHVLEHEGVGLEVSGRLDETLRRGLRKRLRQPRPGLRQDAVRRLDPAAARRSLPPFCDPAILDSGRGPGLARGSTSAVLARGYRPRASGEPKARPLT